MKLKVFLNQYNWNASTTIRLNGERVQCRYIVDNWDKFKHVLECEVMRFFINQLGELDVTTTSDWVYHENIQF